MSELSELDEQCLRAGVELGARTDPAWIALALSRFDEVLVDHAHCEKKAATNALSMMTMYPEIPGLPAAMARLAKEEASHLARVLAIMQKRGLTLGKDPGDPYVQALHANMDRGGRHHRLDKFLVAALVEARSEERLKLLAQHLTDPGLRDFYGELASCEAGHATLFVRLAERFVPEQEVQARLAWWIGVEADILHRLPVRAAVH
ncbi:MAG: tRNA-(ms[2]io[6]A)-hydroxylase [Myxococcales bacterium]